MACPSTHRPAAAELILTTPRGISEPPVLPSSALSWDICLTGKGKAQPTAEMWGPQQMFFVRIFNGSKTILYIVNKW